MQNSYAFTSGNCYTKSDSFTTYRPFFIDGKLIYELDITKCQDEVNLPDLRQDTEIKKLCRAIRNEIGVEILPNELPEMIRSKRIVRKD